VIGHGFRGMLSGFGSMTVASLDTAGVITATGGFVGNVTGNVAGNLTGLVDGVDIDTKAPLASPTFTGTATIPTAAVSTALNVSGIETLSATSPAQWTGNQTDYSGFGSTMVSRISTDASRNIYSATGSSLQFQWIVNTGAQNAVFVHDDGATGTAALRFSLKGSANYTLAPGAWIGRYYDATTARWRLTQP
jgi:hypothetical protein